MALQTLRDQIDQIDEQILKLILVRFQVVEQIGKEKQELSLPTLQIGREEEVMQRLYKLGTTQGLSGNFITGLFKMIIEESKRIQNEQKQT